VISCTFAGHREIYGRNIESSIELAIESILKKDNSFVFYSGDMGEFDKMCSAAVRTAKRRHPELDIKLMVVLPYMMAKVNTDKDFYKNLYDDIIIPMELSDAHYKSAITKRNRWIIDRSDCLIAYVYRDFGGAYTTLKYANRMNKEIINLADTLKQ
jgi:uncharacterized phage-like protein YoqJ